MQDSINLYDLWSILLLADKNGLYLYSMDEYNRARTCIIKVYNDEVKGIFDMLNEYIRNNFTEMPELPSGIGLFYLNDNSGFKWCSTEWAILTADKALESFKKSLSLKPKDFIEVHKNARH